MAKEATMPEKATIKRARLDAREGKAPSTQAGEFVREEIHHIREGKHGARSARQAIAIGLSKARKAGVALPPQPGTKAVAPSSQKRARSSETSATRSRATLSALKKEPKAAAPHGALARQAHKSAVKRGPASLHAAAVKAVATKGSAGLHKAAKKAAATRGHAH
jgi:hypothetical protein